MEGFLRYRFGGLLFGGAIHRGLTSSPRISNFISNAFSVLTKFHAQFGHIKENGNNMRMRHYIYKLAYTYFVA